VLSTNANKKKKEEKACKNGAETHTRQDREGRKIVRLQGDIESGKSIQTNQISKEENRR